jgi:GMP synthase (glutamine-hydrolysing)
VLRSKGVSNVVGRVLLISHEPQAHPALIGELLRERGFDVTEHVVLGDSAAPDTDFPDLDSFQLVMAFGSFANAYDERHRPWVEAELALLEEIVDRRTPYLGVCFGGQLLAESLGGFVEKAPAGHEEIGLVHIAPMVGVDVPSGPWFSWHEDRIVLPTDGSVEVLARNDHAVQLFRRGNAVGLQFHPEADVALVAEWADMGPDHIPAHTSRQELLDALAEAQATTRANCERLVDWFLRDVARVEA